MTRLMQFPEDRVLEDAAFGHGMKPHRIYALLLPVWQVEIRADITEGEDFSLIDRFLERGLRHGALHTVDDLADFLALDRALVAQAVRVLTSIGHLRQDSGRLSLTALGCRSVDDDKRYVISRQDRRRLYFEGLSCTPLRKEHYDQDVVTLLDSAGLEALRSSDSYPRFSAIHVKAGFDREALERLKRRADRARFNVPVAMGDVESLKEELIFLPVYLVRGEGGLLVYGQAGAGAAPDLELSAVCAQDPGLIGVLDNEEAEPDPDKPLVTAARRWLSKHGLDTVAPEQSEDGSWSVSVPAQFFKDSKVPYSRIGGFCMAGNRFFRLRCVDSVSRKHALMERLDLRIGSRKRLARHEAEEIIGRLALQLDLEAPGIPALRTAAEKLDMNGLAAQLARLESGTQ